MIYGTSISSILSDSSSEELDSGGYLWALEIAFAHQFLVLVEFNAVPKTHAAGAEKTWQTKKKQINKLTHWHLFFVLLFVRIRIQSIMDDNDLQARSIKMAVLVMLPAPRRQQPTTPVQKATKSKKKDTMKRAIMARPISFEEKQKESWQMPIHHVIVIIIITKNC